MKRKNVICVYHASYNALLDFTAHQTVCFEWAHNWHDDESIKLNNKDMGLCKIKWFIIYINNVVKTWSL